ncbi:MAG: flagellar hook-basal body complex protein [Magnetococcus sp. MYC-9]
MSITQAMYAGASALTNFSESITVIGNNLANSNTTAFKSSSASFEDVLIQTVGNSGAGNTQVGTGTGLAGVRQDMSQGSFAPSASVTDLSIDGRGFFKVRNTNTSTSSAGAADSGIFYTRAGSFRKDKDGDLVTTGSMVLQGYKLDADGGHSAQMVDVNLAGFDRTPPAATTSVTAYVNLDSSVQPVNQNTKYDPNQPSTYNFSTAVRVFDSQGNGHSMEVQFRRLPMNTPATVMGSGGTTPQQIGVDLEVDGAVTLTFTPVNATGTDQSFSTVVDVKQGHNAIALNGLEVQQGATNIPDLAAGLVSGALYKVKVEPLDAANKVTRVSGDDGRDEITTGADNDSTWEWHAVVNQQELEGSRTGEAAKLKALDLDAATPPMSKPAGASYTVGQLKFNKSGLLELEGSTPVTVQFKGSEKQQILFDFGKAVNGFGDSSNDFTKVKSTDLLYNTGSIAPTAAGDTGGDVGSGSVQVAGGFSTTKLDQDGYPIGTIDKISIDATGVVSGSYTNSQIKKLFQIGLVDFPDEAALDQKGGNLFAETKASGQPLEGTPKSGRLGGIVAFALEQSNVDMSGEFVRMIATQRGFQANSRIVTVVDGMMEELLSLKR